MATAGRVLNRWREPRRAVRIARALWISWAIVVWNVVFDRVIVVAGREYVVAARASAGGSGAYARMDVWMLPAVMRAFLTASAAGLTVFLAGAILIRFAEARLRPR